MRNGPMNRSAQLIFRPETSEIPLGLLRQLAAFFFVLWAASINQLAKSKLFVFETAGGKFQLSLRFGSIYGGIDATFVAASIIRLVTWINRFRSTRK